MNLDKKRIYYNAVFGALGGLLSWAFIGLLLRFESERTVLLFVKDALQGALVGVCIGVALGVVDGLTVSRSVKRTIRGGFLGGLIGLGAGLVGLVLGEIVFLIAAGGVWAVFSAACPAGPTGGPPSPLWCAAPAPSQVLRQVWIAAHNTVGKDVGTAVSK